MFTKLVKKDVVVVAAVVVVVILISVVILLSICHQKKRVIFNGIEITNYTLVYPEISYKMSY